MANKVLLKKSSVASKVPVVTDLDYGELALNYADGLLYYKDATNAIKSIGGSTTSGSSSIDQQSYTATSGQTSFSIKYTAPYVSVYLNGSRLNSSDYTATSGNNIVLSNPAAAGDEIELIGFASTEVVSTVYSAAVLSTPRTINGVSFDGSANISFSTTAVSEGTNLYYTDARARASLSTGVGISYNSSTGAISTSAIPNSSLSNSSVTIGTTAISLGASSTTLAGLTSVTSTSFVGALTGNASTVTNGVYTSGSYSDPSWLTISKSKVGLGSVENTALSTWSGTTNITTLGTITSGTWNGTTIAPSRGGTGVANNNANTITFTGAYSLGLTLSANTSVTLPTTGTLATLNGTETLTNKTLTSPTVTGGLSTDSITTSGVAVIGSDLTVTGNLTVNGTTTTSNSTNTSYADSLIELHYSNGGVLTSNDGKDIGIRMHYYTTSDKNAALVLANDTRNLEFYVDGTETAGVFSGTYGAYRGSQFVSVATTGTAPLIVASTTRVANLNATTAGNADTVTNGVYTTDTGTVTNTMLAGSIATSKITGLAASATTDTTNASNISNGTLPNARLSSVPNSALANSSVTIGTTAISLGSSSTTLGGLTTVTSTSFVGALTGNAATASTATNIAGGTFGDLAYQTGSSSTGFISFSTATFGQALVAGYGAPYWGTPANATTATNVSGGTPGALVYQNSAGSTGFIAFTSTPGQVLTAGFGAPYWATPTTGTVTSVATGTGLSGGTITSTGTISLANTAVTAGSYTYAAITVDAQGRLTAASNGTAPSTTITDDTTTAATRYLAFTSATSGTVTALNTSSTKLQFNPSTGDLAATNFNSLSDFNKKEDIQTLLNAVEIIGQLRGVRFKWKENGLPSIGVIAQEVEKVIPELVVTMSDGTKTVSYGNIVGILIEGFKDHESRLSKLESLFSK